MDQWHREHARKVYMQKLRVIRATTTLNVLLWMQRRIFHASKESYRVGCQRGSVTYHSHKLKTLKRLPYLRQKQLDKVAKCTDLRAALKSLKQRAVAGENIDTIKREMAYICSQYSTVLLQ